MSEYIATQTQPIDLSLVESERGVLLSILSVEPLTEHSSRILTILFIFKTKDNKNNCTLKKNSECAIVLSAKVKQWKTFQVRGFPIEQGCGFIIPARTATLPF